LTWCRVAAVAVGTAAVWGAAPALGADSVYWTNFDPAKVRVGPLTGGNANARDLFTDPTLGPEGIVLDPAAGRMYWTNNFGATIRGANLDGTGTPTDVYSIAGAALYGLAIDTGAGELYWDNNPTKIQAGPVSGGAVTDLFTDGSAVQGVAIDPAAGVVYWTNNSSGTVQVGPITGSGPDHSLVTGATFPTGVAVDPAGGRVYWADQNGIYSAPIATPGSITTLFHEVGVGGIALDPEADKIYWANGSSHKIRVGPLTGGDANAADLFTGEVEGPDYLALLRMPVGTAAPQISGGGQIGQPLHCSQGSWAANLPSAFLYRAPRSFSYGWLRNGAIAANTGAIGSYTPTVPGSYTCQVTASNQAGSSTQTSAALTVVALPSSPASVLTPAVTSPVLTAMTLYPAAFRATSSGPSVLAAVRAGTGKAGTLISYRDSQSAVTTFTILQSQEGVREGKRCVKPPRHPKAARKKSKLCKRVAALGSFIHADRPGQNRLRFTGRAGGRKLLPGPYQLTAVARNGAGKSSSPTTKDFRIKP
jgi:DNA-binding beta-propeller fold protein YncE